MAALQIISLDTTTPQLRAPSAADTYAAPRAMEIQPVSLTGSSATSSLSIAQTWNTTGTPTAIDLNVTDTASNAASLLMDLRVGGTSRFSVRKDGLATFGNSISVGGNFSLQSGSTSGVLGIAGGDIQVRLATYLGWASFVGSSGNADLRIYRDAANTLALRNGVNAQAFNIYNTFTDASNYERGFIRYSSNVLQIGHEGLGTGNNGRSVALFSGGTNYFSVGGGVGVWLVNTSGHLVCTADNTRDIGAAGANRPRNIFQAGYQELSEMTAPAAPAANRVRIYAEDDGAGKTRLMALFATGAAQQIAIEP
jgi:hypothetical protein